MKYYIITLIIILAIVVMTRAENIEDNPQYKYRTEVTNNM